MRPYDQYVQASLDSSSGAKNGVAWIATASATTAATRPARRRSSASPAAYDASASPAQTRKAQAQAVLPTSRPP